MSQSIHNSQIQSLAFQLVIEKIGKNPYCIVATIDHLVYLFLSHSFSFPLELRVEDRNIKIPRANFEL
jgi:hypothetical protein